MSAIDDKIDKIAALQQTTAEQLALLLKRDPLKEGFYGPQYDPNVIRRFQSNKWQMLFLPNAATSQVFTAPNSVEEITINHAIGGAGSNNYILRVEMDDNPLFKNIPANGANGVIFLPPTCMVVAGAGWSIFWGIRLPCVFKWIRVTLVTTANIPNNWTQGAVFNIGFHGQ